MIKVYAIAKLRSWPLFVSLHYYFYIWSCGDNLQCDDYGCH